MRSRLAIFRVLTMMTSLGLCPLPAAQETGGRLIATGGATALEGMAGGGIVPWAVLAGYGTNDQIGGSTFYTRVQPQDYALEAYGLSLSLFNRVELSAARHVLHLDTLGRALGDPNAKLRQMVYGAKLRLFGDIVYTDWPQVAAGIQYKRHENFAVPRAVGALDNDGIDVYLAASKLWLAGPSDRTWFANLTLRSTRANQLGLLGFGGDRNSGRSILAEGSLGVFVNRHWVIGAEYRQKPNNLGFATEEDWHDIFVGWFPNKHVSVVAALARLGSIAGVSKQDGYYLSAELSF